MATDKVSTDQINATSEEFEDYKNLLMKTITEARYWEEQLTKSKKQGSVLDITSEEFFKMYVKRTETLW